ncbi:MAG: hypothetical protein GC168_05560 [Candidatus Hydrogenedens sp.]|nr:hypothetical protein [Candidatus Hydrogenedens sp.]
MKGLAVFVPALAIAMAVQAGPVTVSPDGPLVRKLSEYNLFSDLASLTPNDGVVPYDLNSPLFTDYADKYRFIWMPEGTSATYDAVETFDFPVGTLISKTFSYPSEPGHPEKGMHHRETRVLLHRTSGWVALPYVWNEEQTEANLAVAGARDDIEIMTPSGDLKEIHYIVPNMNQCKACHENQGALRPIGPKARHLNKDFAYPEGAKNQLSKLVEEGYLTGAPENPADAPKLPQWDDVHTSLNDRARAYLDINCGHCHNPKGPAFTSGLDLTWMQDDPRQYGVYKPPVAAGRGSGGHRFSVVPGHPEQSILLHRMSIDDPGSMMPQLGRTIEHAEGIQLISDWIASLKPDEFDHLREVGDGGDQAP